MEREAAALTLALRDPLNPTLCAACLLCFRDYLEPDVRKTNLRVLRLNHHEFWNGAMRFLTVRRTDISRSAVNRRLAATWRACRSPYRTDEDHGNSDDALEDIDHLLREVVGMLFDIVNICLKDSSRRMIVNQKFSRHGLWPSCAAEVLPFGAESSYSSLLYWFTVLGDSTTTAAFTSIILLCRPELTPPLMMPNNRRLLLMAVATHYDLAAREVTMEPALEEDAEQMDTYPQPRMALLGKLLDGLVFGSGSSVDGGRELFQDVPDAFIRAAERALPLIDVEYERNRLATVMDIVYNMRGVPLFERPPEVLKAFHDLQPKLGGAYNILYTVLTHARDARTCSAPDCGRHERDVGRKLQRCSSCSLMHYCSRDCQRRHWKA
ncbi:hypothetical protein EXIGLDRAFT_737375, partial [Exidia glandulosa HHB12029]